MENPFRKESGELDESIVENLETPEEAAPEEEPTELDDDDDEVELFESDDDDDVADEDEDEDEALFDEEKKEAPESIPYKRFQKVIGERNELREKMSTIEARLDSIQELNAVVAEKYKDFRDPAGQAAWDADFVSALEQVKDQPGIKEAVQAVIRYMDSGEMPDMSDNTAPKAKAAREATSAPDPRVEKIIEREAINTINASLPDNVRPAFKTVLTDYILGTRDDLDGLTKAQVLAATREFIEEKGFSRDDVYKGTKGKAADKPATTSGQTAAATADKPAEAGEENAPPKAKDYNEWQKNREARLRNLFS